MTYQFSVPVSTPWNGLAAPSVRRMLGAGVHDAPGAFQGEPLQYSTGGCVSKLVTVDIF